MGEHGVGDPGGWCGERLLMYTSNTGSRAGRCQMLAMPMIAPTEHSALRECWASAACDLSTNLQRTHRCG